MLTILLDVHVSTSEMAGHRQILLYMYVVVLDISYLRRSNRDNSRIADDGSQTTGAILSSK